MTALAHAVDEQTAALLDYLAADTSPSARLDYRLNVDALLSASRRRAVVSANDVRDYVTTSRGLWLDSPARVGSTFHRLARANVLRPSGFAVSTDRKSRNAGRLIPAYTVHPEALT
jgi:hypothetical protein